MALFFWGKLSLLLFISGSRRDGCSTVEREAVSVVNVGGTRGSCSTVERETGNGVMVNVGGEQDGCSTVEREAFVGSGCGQRAGELGGG